MLCHFKLNDDFLHQAVREFLPSSARFLSMTLERPSALKCLKIFWHRAAEVLILHMTLLAPRYDSHLKYDWMPRHAHTPALEEKVILKLVYP